VHEPTTTTNRHIPAMTFNALLVEKNEEGKTNASVQTITEAQLPEGDVLVAVDYSTVNYKDGLCIGPGGGLVRHYPHVPGIDFAGTVESSTDKRYNQGDKVVLTGWRVGETQWGGYAQKARVSADHLVPLPASLDTRQAMAVGTAGVAAALAVMALEKQGMQTTDGPVLVTGATGGVGSVATAMLAAKGYDVAAVTGKASAADYLTSLGAKTIVDRSELSEVTKRPLEAETWAGCVDAVGGEMLARILGQLKYGASAAAVGLAGGAGLPASVIPFLLRGVNLLGIDSVVQPYDNRLDAWNEIGTHLPLQQLESMIDMATLSDLPNLGKAILKGETKGRVVVDVNA